MGGPDPHKFGTECPAPSVSGALCSLSRCDDRDGARANHPAATM